MSTSNNTVEPYAWGHHIHWVGMPVCVTCERENLAWDVIQATNSTYSLAVKITKTPAWRAYRQARPFDDYEAPLSLDLLLENGMVIASDQISPEEEMIEQETMREFRIRLTPKQRKVMNELLEGYTSREIADEQAYKSTGGVRYHRHVIRRKLKDFDLQG